MIQHEQMVADEVEVVDVPPRQNCCGVRSCRHLSVEHLVAELLREPDVMGRRGEANLQEPSRPRTGSSVP